jgi:TetR/AcrR family transcriptional repressor of lmrAB and yxaGH operons
VRASAAPKGSVYHFFPGGKEQIVTEALLEYAPRVERFMATAMAGGRTPAARVRRLFGAFGRRVEDAAFRRSCAFGAVSLDLQGEHETLRRVIGATFEHWVALLAASVDTGDAKRSRALAGLILTAIEGAYIRARAEQSSRPFIEAGDLLAELVPQAGKPRRKTKSQTPR